MKMRSRMCAGPNVCGVQWGAQDGKCGMQCGAADAGDAV